jgi:hypothetical protein
MQINWKKLAGTALTIGLAGSLVLGRGTYFTPWLGALWGVINLVAVLKMSDSGFKGPQLTLKPAAQLIFVVVMLVGTSLATRWSDFGRREILQWAWTAITIYVYRRGLQWGLGICIDLVSFDETNRLFGRGKHNRRENMSRR